MAISSPSILIVDDDREICETLAHLVRREGAKALTAHDGDKALRMIRADRPDMLLVDIRLPGLDGFEVLRRAKDLDRSLPVVVLSGFADISGVVKAMKAGAQDFFSKPFDHREVIRTVKRVLAEQQERRGGRDPAAGRSGDDLLREAMGPSEAIGVLLAEVKRVAHSEFSVVILGETGSGKELVARAIHQASPRAEAPFVPVDCGAIPETLLESELFGHERGAFTGADLAKAGKFEAAGGGTLFLDEMGNLALGSQAKLLRTLQEKKLCRVGSTRSLNVDVRLLAATNQDLEEAVAADSFRRDLFFRLSEFTIRIPPLRERREDIVYLARRFMELTNRELGKEVRDFSASALELLLNFNWPGNVRQLRSAIRRAVLLTDGMMIAETHFDLKRLPVPAGPSAPPPWNNLSLKEIVRQRTRGVEREVLAETLRQTRGNKARAARLLQIDYKTIRTKMKQLGLYAKGGGNG
ncbi:MAG: sigma-54-dependent Fis family transcriptional regulator [Deltaproteobacteria bacterium]|nr:sigma-54-dependent Fis family transcriptional regulator [Deltaproteobacteria bacterium]